MNNPPTDPIYNAFVRTQLTQGMQMAAESDRMALTPMAGNPPRQFILEFNCKSLVIDEQDRVIERDGLWAFGINFPATYLRGGFHGAEVIAYLGPEPRPWHPQIRPPFVCLEVRPATPLTALAVNLYELITWNLYSTSDDGLNKAASQWYRNSGASRSFPVDRRPLKRVPPPPTK